MILELSKIIAGCKYVTENNSSNIANALTADFIVSLMEIPTDSKLGDYTLPCFQLAKLYHRNPMQIAGELKISIEALHVSYLQKVNVIGGYLNFYLDKGYYSKTVLLKALSEGHGLINIGAGKTICMDYSSPNIAKNFHVGHLRTTIIGNSLYHIFTKLGYQVIRINHLGDWGTQFGKLIVAYKKWSSKVLVEKDGINELLRIYVLFHKASKEDITLEEEARSWFVRLEQRDEEATSIWEWFKDISLVKFNQIYDLLGVSFDYYTGESFYMDRVSGVVKELEDRSLIKESQGAKIVNLDQYNMPPCLIVKSNGSSIYPSRDIAALLYRKNTYHFDQCLYITGLEQKLHFEQVFKVIELMGYKWSNNLVHIPYGLVSLAGEKLSTRTGNIIYAQELLNESISRAFDAIDKKNPSLAYKEKIASDVGVGAIIFHELYHQRIKNIDFSWEEVLSFEGATGPYVQYTYARANRILKKNGYMTADLTVDYGHLDDQWSYSLIKKLEEYSQTIINAAKNYEPSIITRYVLSLAQEFNKFYHMCSVQDASEQIKKTRLLLVYAVQNIIKDGMALLGINCPVEM